RTAARHLRPARGVGTGAGEPGGAQTPQPGPARTRCDEPADHGHLPAPLRHRRRRRPADPVSARGGQLQRPRAPGRTGGPSAPGRPRHGRGRRRERGSGAMTTALLYVLLLALVAALLFLLTTVVFGRGEQLTALPRRVRVAEPAPGPVTGDSVRDLRFTLAFRGYRQAEVDRALARLAAEIDLLRAAETAQERAT